MEDQIEQRVQPLKPVEHNVYKDYADGEVACNVKLYGRHVSAV